MLTTLSVSDFVLIDGLTLELDRGLNILTGETGAGKSIVVDALMLVLGGRASPDVIRTGCASAEVEALFEPEADHPVWQALEESGLPKGDSELIVRRVVANSGRSKAYVNGKIVTALQLATITAGLVDIASQHESQSLCDPSTHLTLLDSFANLDSNRSRLSSIVAEAIAIEHERLTLVDQESTARQREDFIRFQIAEIDDIALAEGEVTSLENERKVLKNAGVLSQAASSSLLRLEDSEASATELIRKALVDLERANSVDARLEEIVKPLRALSSELAEVVRALARYRENADSDPDRLAAIDDRMFKIQKLLRRYGPEPADVLSRRTQLEKELSSLVQLDQRIANLAQSRTKLVDSASQLAMELSAARKKAADKLGDAIQKELASLSMGKAKVIVDVAPLDPKAESLQVATGSGDARLSKTGIDRVEMLIAPNMGEDPRPLRKIASGGELSRALLAIKRVLAASGSKGVYVFDEVDAGVGGAVAEAIGKKIAQVGKHHQVLCITHLAQIAAFGDAHFVVQKHESRGRTRSEVVRLSDADRVEELARMIGGSTITTTTRQMAKEMLRSAKAAIV